MHPLPFRMMGIALLLGGCEGGQKVVVVTRSSPGFSPSGTALPGATPTPETASGELPPGSAETVVGTSGGGAHGDAGLVLLENHQRLLSHPHFV